MSSAKLLYSDISQTGKISGYFCYHLAKPHQTVADRLRAFVRERVHKKGRLYQRGAAVDFAKGIRMPQSWVSHYVDKRPDRHADIDTAIRICDYFGVSLEDFRVSTPVLPVAVPRSPLQAEGAKVGAELERLWPRLPAPMRDSLKGLVKIARTQAAPDATPTGHANTDNPGPANSPGGKRNGPPAPPSTRRARGA